MIWHKGAVKLAVASQISKCIIYFFFKDDYETPIKIQ